MHAGPEDCPRRVAFGQALDRGSRGFVMGRISAVRADQNVRVYCGYPCERGGFTLIRER